MRAMESLAGFLGVLFVLLVYIVLFIVVYYVIKRAISGSIRDEAKRNGGDLAHTTARQILDERYARGEISQEEYARMQRDIEG